MNYFIIDLERTRINGMIYFWKGNRRGYTTSCSEAGEFSDEISKEIVDSDVMGETIRIATHELYVLNRK